ncbi:AlkZ family DNA glycosylase [Streptosporangiaceae bacterium NEAU-GS5]|nr:AlkZ family DNA glycosylase [Streptosporangiaceae bacterium NEAU-GS5]
MLRLSWPQVLSWRLRRQFVEPAEGSDTVEVARRLCGVQAQVASSADLALAVRLGRRPDTGPALWESRTLVKSWAMRGTLHLMPSDEWPSYVATLSSLRFWEKPSWLRGHGVTAAEVDAILGSVGEALGEAPLTREELVDAVIAATGDDHLREALTSGWGMLLKPLSILGGLCYGPPRQSKVTFVAPAAWLPGWPAALPSSEQAGPAVVRAFMGAHGPGTPDTFNTWLYRGGVRKQVLRQWFADLESELADVEVDGTPMKLLAAHEDDLAAQKVSSEVHLLPGFDQYVLGAPRDLEPLLPRAVRARVSRTAGWISPVIVHEGRIKGVWEVKDGELAAELFEPVPPFDDKAAHIGRLLGRELKVTVSPGRS